MSAQRIYSAPVTFSIFDRVVMKQVKLLNHCLSEHSERGWLSFAQKLRHLHRSLIYNVSSPRAWSVQPTPAKAGAATSLMADYRAKFVSHTL